jgi:hypothetical protein
MVATGSGDAPDTRDADTWTSETLPMSVRRELLQRELRKLGLHKGAGRGGAPQANAQQQQQPQAPAQRPVADGEGKPHGD